MSWIVISSCCFLSQALTIEVVEGTKQRRIKQVAFVFARECGDDASAATSDSAQETGFQCP